MWCGDTDSGAGVPFRRVTKGLLHLQLENPGGFLHELAGVCKTTLCAIAKRLFYGIQPPGLPEKPPLEKRASRPTPSAVGNGRGSTQVDGAAASHVS